MEFLLFITVDPEGEADDLTDTSVLPIEEWVEEGIRTGMNLRGDRLRPPEDTKVVRRRGGELIVTDGPFTETKEWIAGYDILEAASMDEAIDYASRHPMAKAGHIEVRQVWPLNLA